MASEAPIWDFTEHEDEPLDLVGAVFQAIGGASTCWEDLAGAGQFDPDKAKVIAERLIEWIRAHPEPANRTVVQNAAWQFNEAVSLLREARMFLPEMAGPAEEIDEGLPAIDEALKALAELASSP